MQGLATFSGFGQVCQQTSSTLVRSTRLPGSASDWPVSCQSSSGMCACLGITPSALACKGVDPAFQIRWGRYCGNAIAAEWVWNQPLSVADGWHWRTNEGLFAYHCLTGRCCARFASDFPSFSPLPGKMKNW